MGDYDYSASVEAPAERLFDYVKQVRNLPRYFDQMTEAEPAEGDAVRVVAIIHGEREEGEAWFKVDEDRNRIEWGSEGPNDYHGWLEVSDRAGASTLTVHLHTDRVESGEIQPALAAVVGRVRGLVQGT